MTKIHTTPYRADVPEGAPIMHKYIPLLAVVAISSTGEETTISVDAEGNVSLPEGMSHGESLLLIAALTTGNRIMDGGIYEATLRKWLPVETLALMVGTKMTWEGSREDSNHSPATPEGDAISRAIALEIKDPKGRVILCIGADGTVSVDNTRPADEVAAEAWGIFRDHFRNLLRSLPPQDGERELAELRAENERLGNLFDDICHFRTPEDRRAYLTGKPAALTAQPVAQEAPYHCDKCGRGITMDAVVSHDLWTQISPTGDDGGLLCASCMADAIASATDWPAIFMVNRHDPRFSQPVAQEPVAWRFRHMHLPNEWKFSENPHRGKPWTDFEPLYAHPATPAPVEAGLRRDARDLRRLWALLRGEDPDDLENGPRCRDCADEDGRCPSTGRLCDPQAAAEEAITALRAQSAPVSAGKVKALAEAAIRDCEAGAPISAANLARDVLSALHPGDGWQGIESAPKDGTEFLAHEDGEYYGCARSECDGYWVASCGQPVVYPLSPTHWMPLPAPPSALSQEGGA